MKWYGSVLIAYLMLTGCTSYRDCDTLEDRIEARYKQNVIMPTDSWPLYKGMKHAFFDIITVAFVNFGMQRCAAHMRSWWQDGRLRN